MEAQLLTREEKDKLEADLKRMINTRPEIAQRIAEAREKGDLRENADYHAAREELALLEANIKALQNKLRNVSVVDPNEIPADMVFLGSTVKCKDVNNGGFETFRIVGEVQKGAFDDDSDVMVVSASSPLGEALIRARVGEEVRVKAPRGELRYQVLELL
ncbi:MAG: transcription elongation factor GreA [Phycisphaerae bacterium]